MTMLLLPPPRKRVRIWRVERESDGVGVYWSDIVKTAISTLGISETDFHRSKHNPYNDHPISPKFCDLGPILRKEWFCGFISLDQLYNWFSNPMLNVQIMKLGGVIRIYEVDEDFVMHSPRQAMFCKAAATFIDEMPMVHISYLEEAA